MFKRKVFSRVSILALLICLAPSFCFAGKSRTGGMSELYLENNRIAVTGGFIEWHEGDRISVRGKAPEISITVDNLSSDNDSRFDFNVTNVSPELIEVGGIGNATVNKSLNSISFSAAVEAKKVSVYKLSPKLQDEGYKFMVFGEARGGEHVFERIIGDINYRKPLFVVSCGDMVESQDSGAFDDFAEKISRSAHTFLTVPGSSETDRGSVSLYRSYFGQAYYSFDYKDTHFIFLNNGTGGMSEEQFIWLESDLMQSKSVNKLVFMHTPPFDPRLGKNGAMKKDGQFSRLSRVMEKYKVNFVFSAGYHGYYREEIRGITYIVSGGAGSELASSDAYYNYVIVEVNGQEIKDKVIKLNPPSLPFHKKIASAVKIYLKASFHSHPFRTVILVLVVVAGLSALIRTFYRRIFGRKTKRRLSF